MKHSRNSLTALCLAMLWQVAAAQPQLRDLSINVTLMQNGDARITETRQMEIDDMGTECYIVVGHLNGSRITDLTVSDETGRQYQNVGAWDVSLSREEKMGRCGMVTKHDGYELCWGLGAPGSRTYTTTYTVSALLRGYSDADGFLYMFVAEGLSPSPDHVRLTIAPADSLQLTTDNTAVWAFRYSGDVHVENGTIVAESSEPFSRNSAMIVMARMEKGLFSPTTLGEGTFEQIKERALEDSDYTGEPGTAETIFFVFLFIAVFLFPLMLLLGYLFYVWRERRKVMKDMAWWREIPFEGNLQTANNVLNAYRYFSTDYNNLLSACILKLINLGAISIKTYQNQKGKTVQNFEIHELKNVDGQPVLLRQVHNIFLKAAGQDSILEPKELRQYMRAKYSQSTTDTFIQTLHTKTSIREYRDELDEVRHLYELKKYLKEFSLIDERHVSEVSLWKDYMIYATLFGIADQVIRDMKKINPEYFNMDQVAQQMADDRTLPIIYSTMNRSTARAAMSKAEREARASGRGGSASWGGGGGFSGGGFGGGVR